MLIALIAYFSSGALIGLLSGLFGIGGGIVGIPVLLQCFARQGVPTSLSMHMAIGTMLAVAATTALAAMRSHHKNDMILVPLVRRLAPFLVLGSLAGTVISSHLNSICLQRIFAVFLLFAACRMVWTTKPHLRQAVVPSSVVAIVTFSIGIVSGLIGLGGGILLVPFLNWCGISLKHAIATATACIVPATVLGALSYMIMNVPVENSITLSTGYVYWPAFLGISMVSVFFAPVGAYLTQKTSTPVLKGAFSILLTVVAVHLAK